MYVFFSPLSLVGELSCFVQVDFRLNMSSCECGVVNFGRKAEGCGWGETTLFQRLKDFCCKYPLLNGLLDV